MVDADWYAFCQAVYKEIEGSEWEEVYHHYREMSKAFGAKKPRGSQKAQAGWAIKTAKTGEMNSMTQPATWRISIKADCWLEAFVKSRFQ